MYLAPPSLSALMKSIIPESNSRGTDFSLHEVATAVAFQEPVLPQDPLCRPRRPSPRGATTLSPVSGPGPGCGKGRGWSAYAAPLKWLCFFVFQTYICIYSPVLDVLIRKPVFNVPSCIYLLRGCKAIQ